MLAVLGGLSYMAVMVSGAVTIGFFVLLVVLLGLAFARSRVSATITGPDGLVVRRLFETRRTAWPDIQDIKVETRSVWTVKAREVRRAAVAFDRGGHRIALPNLDEANVSALDDEVRRVRALWERRRGEDWTPESGAAAAMERSARDTERRSAWLLGSVLTLGLLFCVAASIVAGLTGAPIAVVVFFAVIPVLAGGTGLLVFLAQRRRAQQPAPDAPEE